MAALIAGPL